MPPSVLRVPSRAALACMAAACSTMISACSTTPPALPVLAEIPTPLVAGQRLVSPITPSGSLAASRQLEAPPPLTFSDGQQALTRYVRLNRTGDVQANTWLPSAPSWEPAAPPGQGMLTVLTAAIPQDALGQSAWVDGRQLAAFWIVPDFDAPPRPEPLSATLTPAQRELALQLAGPELRDPLLRWRAVMALQRFDLEASPIDDPLLADWAAQWSTRADAALRRLAEVDPQACHALIETLTRWLITPDGPLPAWPLDAEAISTLVLAILRPGATDRAVQRAARAFLDDQPEWLAWVADDAGGIVGGQIAVANLAEQPSLLSARAPGGRWNAAGMVPPKTVVKIPAPSSDGQQSSPPSPAAWQVRLGGRTRILPVATNAIELTPPGVAIGPFWYDWTLEGLAAGTAASAAPGSAGWVAGLLHADPRLDDMPGSSSGWAVYFEVHRPPCDLRPGGASGGAVDAIRLMFGPSASPRAEVRVRCTGLTSFERLTGTTQGESAMLTTERDRWTFTLPIDRSWLEPDGTILLGVQFLPADGLRATWPRPLLPGQDAPGRVRINPAGWGLPSALSTSNQPAAQ